MEALTETRPKTAASSHTLLKVDANTGDFIAQWGDQWGATIATDGRLVWSAGDGLSGRNTEIVRELTTGMRATVDVDLTQIVALPDGRVVGSSATNTMRMNSETLRGSVKGMSIPFNPNTLSTGEHALLVSDGWTGSAVRLRRRRASCLLAHQAPFRCIRFCGPGVLGSSTPMNNPKSKFAPRKALIPVSTVQNKAKPRITFFVAKC